jgi:isopentenyldiphosphate isomerase
MQIIILIVLILNITLINDEDNITDIATEADNDTTDTALHVVISICLFVPLLRTLLRMLLNACVKTRFHTG